MRKGSIIAGLILIVMLLLVPADHGWAHGVGGRTASRQALCLIATYDNGEPMSYARVEVAAPGADLPFQSGRTDRNGTFCIVPDVAGKWQLVVSDEMGHRYQCKRMVGADLVTVRDLPANGFGEKVFFSKAIGAMAGIVFIFGCFGSLYWWLRRKKGPRAGLGA